MWRKIRCDGEFWKLFRFRGEVNEAYNYFIHVVVWFWTKLNDRTALFHIKTMETSYLGYTSRGYPEHCVHQLFKLQWKIVSTSCIALMQLAHQPPERRPGVSSKSACGGSQPCSAPRTAPAATYLHPSPARFPDSAVPYVRKSSTMQTRTDSIHATTLSVMHTHLQRQPRWRRDPRRRGTRPGMRTSRAPRRSGGPRPRRWRWGGPARRGRPRRHARRHRSRHPPPRSGTVGRRQECAPARTASRPTTPRTRTRPPAGPRTQADHLRHPPCILI